MRVRLGYLIFKLLLLFIYQYLTNKIKKIYGFNMINVYFTLTIIII